MRQFDHTLAQCGVCPLDGLRRAKPKIEVLGKPSTARDKLPIMFIGEAPGRNEVLKREVFIGDSGTLLTGMLEKCGVTREQVWITNALLCRPPDNDIKEADGALEACHGRLTAEIEAAKPKVIVTLGATAYRAVAGVVRDAVRRRLQRCKSCEGAGYARREDAAWLSSRERWGGGDPNEPVECPKCDGKGKGYADVLVDRLTLPRTLTQDVGSTMPPEEREWSIFEDAPWTLVPVFHPAAMIRTNKKDGGAGASILGPALIPATVRHLRRAIAMARGETTIPNLVKELWLVQGECPEAEAFLKLHGDYTIDIETEPLDKKRYGRSYDPAHHRITVVGIGRDGICYVFDWTTSGPHHELVREFLARPEVTKVGHFFTSDVGHLEYHVGPVEGSLLDTALLHHAVWPEELQSLGFTAHTYLGVKPWKPPKSHSVKHFKDLESLATYNGRDVIYTDALIEPLLEELAEERINPELVRIDMECIRVAADMQLVGVPMSKDRLDLAAAIMEQRQDELLARFRELAGPCTLGDEWYPSRPAHLRHILFELWGLPGDVKTKTGLTSTKKDVLHGLRHMHEGVEVLLDLRKAQKTVSTNVRPWVRGLREHPEWSDPPWHALHGWWKPCIQVLGRWSVNPNFMATSANALFHYCLEHPPTADRSTWERVLPLTEKKCPICGAKVKKFSLRSIICAPPGWKLCGADLAAAEFKMAAALTGGKMREFCNRPSDDARKYDPTYDAHSFLAERTYASKSGNLFLETDEFGKYKLRTIQKRVDFGLLYLGTEETLYKNIRADSPTVTARMIHDAVSSFHREFPEYRKEMDKRIADAYAKRAVFTRLLNRRRPYVWGEIAPPDIANVPVQGTIADMMNMAIVRINDTLKARKMPAYLILQVHDQIVAMARDDVAEETTAIIAENMRGTFDFGKGSMLFDTEAKCGQSWGDL